MTNLNLRPYHPQTDECFVYRTWLKSYRFSEEAWPVQSTIYYRDEHALIESLLQTAETIVASDPEDGSHLLGFICGKHDTDLNTIHYVYVKKPFRELGVGGELIRLFVEPNKFLFCTHETDTGKKILTKMGFVYRPLITWSKEQWIPSELKQRGSHKRLTSTEPMRPTSA